MSACWCLQQHGTAGVLCSQLHWAGLQGRERAVRPAPWTRQTDHAIACNDCICAGEKDGRPTWTWSAPLFMTVTAAGVGLTLGYTEIGEQQLVVCRVCAHRCRGLQMTVTAAGVGLTLGYTDIGEQQAAAVCQTALLLSPVFSWICQAVLRMSPYCRHCQDPVLFWLDFIVQSPSLCWTRPKRCYTCHPGVCDLNQSGFFWLTLSV